jgi:nitrite reductase/ring-hydroxylating ferredoxin subunit
MAEFKKACLRADVKADHAKNVTLDGVEITIFQTPTGYVARSGVCKHNAFKLELCEISGDVVRCPLHGWTYRISNGKGIKPSWTTLDHFDLEVRGEEIWVKTEASKQDEDFDTSSFQW